MACGACASRRAPAPTFKWASADGKTTAILASETEAKAKVRRSGGTYKKQ